MLEEGRVDRDMKGLGDDPGLAASQLGPKVPHIGYQTAGKRRRTGSLSGHILVQRVHVARGRASEG